MCHWVYIAIIIVLLIVITYLALHYNSEDDIKEYLSGMWVGDEEFNKNADVSEMFLYIGPQNGKIVSGYLFMGDKDSLVSNQKIELTFVKDTTPKNSNSHTKRLEYNIEYFEEDIMPKTISFEFNMMEGWLKLYSNDTLHGYFFKDNSSSVLVPKD